MNEKLVRIVLPSTQHRHCCFDNRIIQHILLVNVHYTQHFFIGFYRAVLCIRGTSHGLVSVCPSVCLSVTSRCSTKTAKRRITQTTPHDTPKDSRFLIPKISAKFDRGHPLRGRQTQVGWVKIGDCRQITGYISKTVQDRHIVSIKVE